MGRRPPCSITSNPVSAVTIAPAATAAAAAASAAAAEWSSPAEGGAAKSADSRTRLRRVPRPTTPATATTAAPPPSQTSSLRERGEDNGADQLMLTPSLSLSGDCSRIRFRVRRCSTFRSSSPHSVAHSASSCIALHADTSSNQHKSARKEGRKEVSPTFSVLLFASERAREGRGERRTALRRFLSEWSPRCRRRCRRSRPRRGRPSLRNHLLLPPARQTRPMTALRFGALRLGDSNRAAQSFPEIQIARGPGRMKTILPSV